MSLFQFSSLFHWNPTSVPRCILKHKYLKMIGFNWFDFLPTESKDCFILLKIQIGVTFVWHILWATSSGIRVARCVVAVQALLRHTLKQVTMWSWSFGHVTGLLLILRGLFWREFWGNRTSVWKLANDRLEICCGLYLCTRVLWKWLIYSIC